MIPFASFKKVRYLFFEFGRKYKSICDQLAAVGQRVDETDKVHWFLCGLGPYFESFSVAHHAVKPRPLFCDLLASAEDHELFLKSVHNSSTHHVSFNANTARNPTSYGRGSYARGSRGGRSGSRGHGRRPPHF